ncbi:MAG: transcriptional regulator AlsR family [Holophagaceae bacterium]|nr:transcriptional regulator AlsR family [Holophagaceae bacterium]
MDFSKLRYFVAVAERLSFTAAADALCISQSTVSRHVADFEEELGRQLFSRNRRSVRLTPAGVLMLNEAYAIQSRMEEALRKVRELDGGMVGKLRLGMLGTPTQKIFPLLTRRFHRDHPGVELEVQRLSWRLVNEHLHKGRLDLGFTLSMGLEHFPDLAWESVCTDRMMVVMPADHPLASESCIDFARLAREPFVLPSRIDAPAGSEWFSGLCAKAGFLPRVVAEPEHLETTLAMVESGLGICVLAGHVAQGASERLRFVPFADESSCTDLVVAWKRDNPNPALPLFIAGVKAYVQEQPIT